jgi:hypothetical protein
VTSVVTLLQAVSGAEHPGVAHIAGLARVPADLTARWVNEEARATLIGSLLPDRGAAELAPLLDELRAELAELQRRHPGFEARLAGLAVVSTHMSVGMIGDLARSLSIAAIVIFGTISAVFGSLRLGLASIVPNFLPLAGVGALLFARGLPLQYTSVAVFSIGLGLAVDDTIHLLTAYRWETRNGRADGAAIRRAVRHVAGALMTTTLLLTAGLATLMLSELPMVFRFGFLMCVFLVLALLADLALLPSMLAVLAGPLRGSRSRRRASLATAATIMLLFGAGAAFGARQAPPSRPGPQASSTIGALRELAKPGEHHVHLAALVGSWTATGSYWLPSGEIAEASGRIENRWILDGLFLESRLSAELLGDTYEGLAIDGYDYVTGQYMGSYADNLGTFVLHFTGVCEEEGRRRTMIAEFIDPVWGRPMVNRSVTTIIDPDTYRYESFLRHEDGREFKQMEFTARRVR